MSLVRWDDLSSEERLMIYMQVMDEVRNIEKAHRKLILCASIIIFFESEHLFCLEYKFLLSGFYTTISSHINFYNLVYPLRPPDHFSLLPFHYIFSSCL